MAEVGPCKQGAPILMSMPHFMNADPTFAQNVEGMNPDPEKHTFIMDHEPVRNIQLISLKHIKMRKSKILYIKKVVILFECWLFCFMFELSIGITRSISISAQCIMLFWYYSSSVIWMRIN